jgi:integrase/recombinase XerC
MITFRDYLTARDLAAATINAYIVDMGLFAAWYHHTNGERLTGAFTPTDVREYRAHLKTVDRAAPATINRKIESLRSYGAYLVSTGQLEANPAAGAKGVREQQAAPKWLERKDQARLMRELEKELYATRTDHAQREALRNHTMVVLMLHTGLRVAEVCALDIADLTLHERSGELRVRSGKGDKARTVPLNADVRKALRAWLVVEARRALDPLFNGRTGERLTPRGVQKMIAKLAHRAGVELTPHTLRHTFAKNLINAEVSAEKIAPMMGHASVRTTAIYTTPSKHDLELAVEKLED